MKYIWVCLSLMFLSTFSYADDPKLYLGQYKDFNNGCGSGFNEKLVPDSIFGIDLIQACANHDNCYSKCLEGGENYGKPICDQQSEKAKELRRAVCDQKFRIEIQNICNQLDRKNFAKVQICELIANVYPYAVDKGGKGSFNGVVIPDSMLTYLQKNKLEDREIEKLGEEIRSLSQVEGIQENTIILKIEDGKPKAVLEGKSYSNVIKSENLTIQRKLMYGDNIDLSNATINEKPINIKQLQ